MVVMHNKTGNLYKLIDDKCAAKINGEWVDAVLYQCKDEETARTKTFVREKSDFYIHFTTVRILTADANDTGMADRIAVLKEVAEDYPGKTIENIIAQLEARKREVEKK